MPSLGHAIYRDIDAHGQLGVGFLQGASIAALTQRIDHT